MEKREFMAFGALLSGALALGYAFLAPPNEQELITAVLSDLAATVSLEEPIGNPIFHASRLSGRFEDIFAEEIHLQVADVGVKLPSRRGQLGLVTAKFMSRLGSFHVEFVDLNFTIKGETAAVKGFVVATANVSGERKQDERPVRVELSKASGDWLINILRIESPSHE